MPSMTLAEWPDGFVLGTDGQRDDPLYYYTRRDAWDSAIGFEVSPLYAEQSAHDVSIRTWPSHAGRVADMGSADRVQVYCRTVSALLSRFPRWNSVTLHAAELGALIDDPSLVAEFRNAGFCQSGELTPNQRRWAKA